MSESHRILLIEDSPTQAERLRALLAGEGWQVQCAASAEAALDELNRSLPDLIVVDYHLPGMQGDEFCREIRMNVNTRGIPVLMLTVEGTDAAETRGLESGADDYLAKSVDHDLLLLRVRALLRKSHRPEAIVARAETFLSQARVLAIDDSPTFLQYLAQELSSENYVVERAASGTEGLERIRNEGFDCALVDLEMPDPDGLEVCRRIAEMRRTGGVPIAVLVLTAYDDREYMTRSLEAGADDFVGKSADPAVLKARIRALLRRRFFIEENRHILEELKNKELEAVRARAEKEAAEMRALMAGKLEASNRELEAANRRLREALDVTRAITQHAAEALFLMDAAGRVTFMNPAAERMFGYRPEELLGQVLHEKIHGGSGWVAEQCPLYRPLLTGETITGHEDLFLRRDGSRVEVSCSNAPILQDGRVHAAVLVLHDISERKRSEERLRQAQKMESIGLLAGGIAHDFNNILTSIIGTASMIEEELRPSEGVKIRAILDGAEKAALLTRQLLAYAGKGQFIVEDMDLSAVVREMMDLIRLSLPKSIEIGLELADGLPMVSGDPTQMQQVLMNLVLNGAEAIGPDGGQVSVSTGVDEIAAGFIDAAGNEVAPGHYVYLQVADTGCGIGEQLRARIFDPFFTTKFTGRGLGLAAVSGIVRAQQGAITIASAPGAGSTFRVLLPAGGRSAPRERPSVLVVDDEPGVRDFIRGALERDGFAVLSAGDGKEGLSLWEQHRRGIRLVLLDLILPAMSGPQLLAEIKRREPEAKVLLTSGHSDADAERLCAEYAATTFIQKPYTSQKLLEKVHTVMGWN